MIDFTRFNFDPCLYMKQSTKGIIYIALHIDDNLMVWSHEANDEAVRLLQEYVLLLKVDDVLQDYLFSKVRFSQEMKKARLAQQYLF